MGNPPYDNSDLPYCITDHLEGSSPAEKVLSQHPSDHPAELVFPAQVSSLITGLILYKENSPWYGWLIFLYWLIEFLCYFIVLRAFRNIYAREKEHELLVQQMDFTRKQMEFSQEMEKEYRSVRKWNHDMENHLFSLNYLINTKKYDEAEKYLESLLSDLPQEKRNL